ncbi:hypothetical protein CH253_16865 [Rhodococcus sp. 06-156-3C]|uniref:hypothetical protein n=1 Tax=Nocardiaceae TaxID=85025 RepID=UPI000522E3CC|nr:MULTISPECIES: hypothetical protein [Rhodococcus]OZD18158.1 hypothetical protein CH280_06190 [Rhodococcus sp. 06-156-4C]OZD18755.1 hypothetical protein CH253_16865 [Rhodococcus sp. 06-156-3C]OZD22265.1 hypothetical protein CH248_08450 [Rhodococcus sp. 06-156-4a]OZD34071.1 hypothetical protein CH247_08275 [Rhodococcus sp. 06-156-3b]OZD38808.1 hypothetical protein CH284_06695 [Rhodococcus sp. 06-156-3]
MTSDHDLRATAVITRDHAICDGHFPGSPIVPGVTMLALCRRAAGGRPGHELGRLIAVHRMRFTLPAIPPCEIAAVATAVANTSTTARYKVDISVDGHRSGSVDAEWELFDE